MIGLLHTSSRSTVSLFETPSCATAPIVETTAETTSSMRNRDSQTPPKHHAKLKEFMLLAMWSVSVFWKSWGCHGFEHFPRMGGTLALVSYLESGKSETYGSAVVGTPMPGPPMEQLALSRSNHAGCGSRNSGFLHEPRVCQNKCYGRCADTCCVHASPRSKLSVFKISALEAVMPFSPSTIVLLDGISAAKLPEKTCRQHQEYKKHMAMGQNPVPPVNIPIPTKID